MRRIDVGDTIKPRELATIQGQPKNVPDGGQLVHLQFRRFAGCPICNLHLRAFTRRQHEVQRAGIQEVVVFHSTPESMRRYQHDLPFPAVADPDRRLYAEFGVETSLRSVLDPRAWSALVRGLSAARSLRGAFEKDEHLGLPADILIATDGRVVARKYGAHADDQWSVDDLLALAATALRQ